VLAGRAPGQARRTAASPHDQGQSLRLVRAFFTRLLEWEIADAPTNVPVLASDMPIPDETRT
jgi:hypothetical protein